MKKPRRYKSSPHRRYADSNRRRNPWSSLIALAVLSALVFVIAKFILWAANTPYFSVKEVTVEGLKYLPKESVLTEMDSVKGHNIFKLKLGELEKKLENFPWVKQARFYRSLPSTLALKLSERAPLALLNSKGRLIVIDYDGNLLAPPLSGEVYDLPIISNCSQGGDNYLEAVNFLRAAKTLCPQIYAEISEVHFSEESNCITGFIGEKAVPVKIGGGSYREKIIKLWVLMKDSDISFNELRYADIRFPKKIFYIPS